MNKLSLLFILGLVVTFLVGGLTGYTLIKVSSAERNLQEMESELADLRSEIVKYESAYVEQALSAKNTLDLLAEDGVEWSDVVTKILATTPKDTETKAPKVEYSSFSGSKDNRLIVSAKTAEGSEDPFADAANLIRAYEGSPYFRDPFIPGISSSVSEEGIVVLGFSFNVEYVEDEAGAKKPVPVKVN
ncbi:hypothetical protein HOE67_03735 [Candidatus Peregrinibacteria bacterium]|jgi:hypothetical protein|nr:hypothetical protein [Candidatus Peregrinibacteria bacterium]MBT4056197.1 hypothetical protein [Candidatus Peregrinibacteria bacterium]